jgi:hypothetical protein
MQLAQIVVSERVAAEAIGCHPDTLRNWRRAGIGPPWIRMGPRAIRYPVKDLRAWIREMAQNEQADA